MKKLFLFFCVVMQLKAMDLTKPMSENELLLKALEAIEKKEVSTFSYAFKFIGTMEIRNNLFKFILTKPKTKWRRQFIEQALAIGVAPNLKDGHSGQTLLSSVADKLTAQQLALLLSCTPIEGCKQVHFECSNKGKKPLLK